MVFGWPPGPPRPELLVHRDVAGPLRQCCKPGGTACFLSLGGSPSLDDRCEALSLILGCWLDPDPGPPDLHGRLPHPAAASSCSTGPSGRLQRFCGWFHLGPRFMALSPPHPALGSVTGDSPPPPRVGVTLQTQERRWQNLQRGAAVQEQGCGAPSCRALGWGPGPAPEGGAEGARSGSPACGGEAWCSLLPSFFFVVPEAGEGGASRPPTSCLPTDPPSPGGGQGSAWSGGGGRQVSSASSFPCDDVGKDTSYPSWCHHFTYEEIAGVLLKMFERK